jgi:hypothetical protein
MKPAQLLTDCLQRCAALDVALPQFIFAASVAAQKAVLFEQPFDSAPQRAKEYPISTSKFGIGQIAGSNQTPLGLHRIAEKIGAGCPAGTVFKSRKVIGHLQDGLPLESITTRILWLEGLEEGLNRGRDVDTHSRYIYIHGFGDQASLGKPASLGCIHLADADLIPLYDLLPSGTLVWIAAQ